MYSEFLKSRHDICRDLINRLQKRYAYVSLLGKHVVGDTVVVTTSSVNIGETNEAQCGFVVKIYNGTNYSEYAFTDITGETIDHIEQEIIECAAISENLKNHHAQMNVMDDLELTAAFERPMEGERIPVPELVEKMTMLKNGIEQISEKIVQTKIMYDDYDVSAMFLSPHRDLSQNYFWNALVAVAIARDGEKMQRAMEVSAENSPQAVFAEIEHKKETVGKLAVELLDAEMIKPGVYDVITMPDVTGLIAHEAFGHGVEMDMFVKNRARSRHYIGKPVASPLISMHDGASACKSCVGYFFDDDGVLAHDTLIIKDGILQTGISDAVSAMQLGTEPTGNGRREQPSHKAYTRMTNTYFEPGHDKVEDMIASISYGYMLCGEDNGMEDPKNWNIQCTASYAREIRDGKFTGKIVAPVVMSGYVPDLLMSISMVSDKWKVTGFGYCGKGYKEWVPVSDGGPYLKAKCKLG